MRHWLRLIQIKGDRAVTKETDPEFWFQCQRAVLLALKEDGVLGEAPYRCAEELLKQKNWQTQKERGETLS